MSLSVIHNMAPSDDLKAHEQRLRAIEHYVLERRKQMMMARGLTRDQVQHYVYVQPIMLCGKALVHYLGRNTLRLPNLS